MLSYKDKTFCNHWRSCSHGPTCDRALTGCVALSAEAWWGSSDAPVSVWRSAPDCHQARSEAAP